jgi:hypothetical protein
MAATDIDGFNLAYAVTPDTFTDIVDLVVPNCSGGASISASMRPAPCGRSSLGLAARFCHHPSGGNDPPNCETRDSTAQKAFDVICCPRDPIAGLIAHYRAALITGPVRET